MNRIRWLVVSTLFSSLLPLFARAQQPINNVVQITVTNSSANITVNRTCYYVAVRENAASPSATFSITLTGTSVSQNFAAGAIFVFNAPQGQPFTSGQTIGTIVATTAGPFNFTATESGSSPPSMQAKVTTNGGGGGGGAPSGPAGGDLSGSYPNPTVSQLNGGSFATFFASAPAIGGTAPASGAFTTLSASSTVSGTGFSTYLASPPAIGGTAPAAGSFTTLTATTSVGIGGSPPSCGSATGVLCASEAATAGTPASAIDYMRANSSTHSFECSLNNGSEAPCNPTLPTSWTSGHVISGGTWPLLADSGVVAANLVVASSPGAGIAHFAGSTQTATSSPVVSADLNITGTTCTNQVVTVISSAAAGTCTTVTGAYMANNTVTATQLAAQYSKGQCTEVWGGSGTSFALTSGDDAISNNTCYNDSGVTRTITAVKCRSDNSSNTTTVNPTFGAAGTGTTILSGALTCGSSLAYSASGTVSNASWTTGTGINPVMGGTLTGTSISMLVDFTY